MTTSPQSIDYGREFERAGTLLSQNWIIALPTAVASLAVLFLVIIPVAAFVVGSIVSLGTMHAAGLPFVGIGFLGVIGGFLAATLVSIIAHAAVIRAAADAWEGRPVQLATALTAAFARLPALVVAALAILILLIIPIALSFIFIGIPLIFVVWYLLIFTLPAIMLDNQNGFDAISTSFRITTRQVGPSLVAAIGIWVVMIVAHVIGGVIGHIPLLGWLAFFAIGGLAQAYAALVSARFYTLLRAL